MSRRKIDQLLSSQGRRSGIARLIAHASSREAWTAALRALLPAELCSECQVANVRDHVLTVHINNAAWATRFRFLIPELLPKLNRLADFASVREVRIKVVAAGAEAPSDPIFARRDRQPPNAELLRDFADSLDYGELREAILRLARQLGRTPGRRAAGPGDVP
jgi:hypothetical protein